MITAITAKDVEEYMCGLLPPRDAVLAKMEEEASKRDIPIIGPAVGRVLFQLARLAGARRVFEMGSAIGYSTLWLARAVGDGGEVYYSDGSGQNACEASGYFIEAGVMDRVRVLTGNSLELIDAVDGEFDIVFNDVDKHYYPEVFRKAVPRIRRGGLFITDNVLWSGRVARDTRGTDDAWTLAIREFNRLIYEASNLFTTILPIRDGVAVCTKL